MKKVLFVLIAAATITACDNAADSTQRAKDSLDSIANVKKDVIDSTTQEKKETLDSLEDRRDSINSATDTTRK